MATEVSPSLKKNVASQVLASTALKTKTRLKDVLNVQDSFSRKLLSCDAQRITDVLENCISRVEIVAILPSVFAHMEELSQNLDETWWEALQRHQVLESQLEMLEQPASKFESKEEEEEEEEEENKEKEEKMPDEATAMLKSQLENDVKNSIRDLLRLFRKHPNTGCCLRAEAGVEEGMSRAMDSLLGGLKQFFGQMSHQLPISPEEERKQDTFMQELFASHERNKRLIAELEKKCATAAKESSATTAFEVSQKESVIEKLTKSLQLQKTMSDDAITRMQLEADKECQSHAKVSEKRQAELQKEINQRNEELNMMIHQNFEIEREMHQKNERVRKETESLIKLFDEAMGREQAKLESMQAEYEKEIEELRRLEEADIILMVEYNQIQVEVGEAEEKKRQENRRLWAAMVIQAWWKGYCIRKVLQAQMKDKKPKKGKGKKGKKGKGKK